ncbi:MAG: hypothetical protein JRJ54_14755 [Deltaproteobacteria bacterium]|nr:hypothetical protein [Deltaproteobacteria bacterium]
MVREWIKRLDIDHPGCTLWPEGDWHFCCVRHDYRYADGGSWRDKVRADWELGWCVAGTGHPFIGGLMFIGTLIFGALFWREFRAAQAWAELRRG